jgi:pyruvate,water dikinase
MSNYILNFTDPSAAELAMVGGKGANLAILSQIRGLTVPQGFCITTAAYKEIVSQSKELHTLVAALDQLKAGDREQIQLAGQKIRSHITQIPLSAVLEQEIADYIRQWGEQEAYAIRSSATAEDLQDASFAGQQDSYLNIKGISAILEHVRKCWASLYTDRAISYRIQHEFEHSAVLLSVIVQQMIFPEAAGILFTADPVTGNRNTSSIDASFGLGEALVAGKVNADNYKVHAGTLSHKTIGNKQVAIYAAPAGGTTEVSITADLQHKQVLTDEQIIELGRIGRNIAAHFGKPQDIEWCLSGNIFYIVQSRPITTLFPIPKANDSANHVYVSVGHQQMMTDAMRPLGLSVWQLTTPRPMAEAGGRLFVDVSQELASAAGRNMLINVLGKSDPLIKDALSTLLEREDFIQQAGDEEEQKSTLANFQVQIDYDRELVPLLIQRGQQSIADLEQEIQSRSGVELMYYIADHPKQLRQDPMAQQSFAAIMTGMNAASWINEKMAEWLDEKNAADTLALSVPNNITSEMGLALMDLADAVRPYPEVIHYLQTAASDSSLDDLAALKGGDIAKEAFAAFLEKYGMRCPGEIDITRTRWAEQPLLLAPLILTNIRNFEPGAAQRKFDQGLQEAGSKEKELLERLQPLPGAHEKIADTKKMIELLRNYSGYREYPKYFIVCRYFLYKQALLREAECLVSEGLLQVKEDIFYLRFEELRTLIATQTIDQGLISQRKEEQRQFEKMNPPRVLTSDGEMINGSYQDKDLPENALAGLAVSAGTVEGRARVILDIASADLKEGDILVTRFTDPSWTPLFLSVKGLVTEVGGLMTHGAVIAREYGIAAVVGVAQATTLIKDGQQIRVNGTEGYVAIL